MTDMTDMTDMNQTGSRGVLGIAFVVVGVACIVLALFLYQQGQAFSRIAKTATGTVIDMETKRSSSSSSGSTETTFAPVIKFVTSTGQTIQFTSSDSQNPPAYQIGDPVDVLYDPQNPNHAELPGSTNIAILIAGGLGFVFVLVGGNAMMSAFFANK